MNRIKELRLKKGLLQSELAKKIGVAQTTVSAWEIGKCIPDKKTLIDLASFFDVSVEYLLGQEMRKEEMSPRRKFLKETLKNTHFTLPKDNSTKLTEDECEEIAKRINYIKSKKSIKKRVFSEDEMIRIINTTQVEMQVKCMRPKYYGKERDVKINVLENEVKIKAPKMVSCKSYSEKAEWCHVCLMCIFSHYKRNPKEKYDEVQDFRVTIPR